MYVWHCVGGYIAIIIHNMNECTGQQSFKMKSRLCVACVLLLHLMVNLPPGCLCDSGNGTTSVSESGNGPASGSGEQQFSGIYKLQQYLHDCERASM